MSFSIVEGNILPVMKITLYEDLVPFVIGGSDVMVLTWTKPDGSVHTTTLATLVANDGTCTCTWVAGDTDQPGPHYGQVDLTRSGVTRTFPNNGTLLTWDVFPHL